MVAASEPADAADASILLLAPLLTVTALCGAYTILYGIATYVLLRRGLKRPASRALFAVISALYASTIAHWAVNIKSSVAIGSTDSNNVESSERLGLCVPDVALTVNTVLSDGVVWWRVWVIWDQKPLLLIPAIVLVLLTLVLSSVNAYDTCRTPDIRFARIRGPYFSNNPFGTATVVASLLTNLLAILLIGYKAWQHRRFIKQYLSRLSKRTWSEEVLHMLVESAVVYCILWAFVLGSALGSALDPTFLEAAQGMPTRKLSPALEGYTLFEWVLLDSLVPIIGMYPTLVVLLVTLKGSQLESPRYRFSSHSLAPMSFQSHSADPPMVLPLGRMVGPRTRGTVAGLESRGAIDLPPWSEHSERGGGLERSVTESRLSLSFVRKEEAQEDGSTSVSEGDDRSTLSMCPQSCS
ncbi:hypothetical protein BV20DRAFT_480376 [Pilatotrama ljubarskyi]|nr:hypothetical protein BV20DRAFT_480376 [Pilatotrama ljubarskyi]